MLEIRHVKAEEIDMALSIILDDKGQTDANSVRLPRGKHSGETSGETDRFLSFKKLAQQENYDLTRQVVVVQQNCILYACMFIPQGSSAFVLTASGFGCQSEAAVGALRELIRWAFSAGCSLLQIMLEPEDISRLKICQEAGFWRMTDLIYLYLPVLPVCPGESLKIEYADQDAIKWVNYNSSNHELFKDVIQQSYQRSLDCPELENLRGMESVISSHKAAGEFDPQYWKILLWNDKPAGVLLLSPLARARVMELTYMGLVLQARGHNLGRVLLQQACLCCRDYGAQNLILAQDCRNHYAYNLYISFGFKVTFRRSVLICSPADVIPNGYHNSRSREA